MNILLVQPYFNKKFSREKFFGQLVKIIEEKPVELIVFPEGYMGAATIEEAWEIVEDLEEYLDTPIICGISFPDGTERALYVNGAAEEGETEKSIFIKHSTAKKLAFDLDPDDLKKMRVYEPVILNDKRIQVYICHDMFFPLVTEKLEQEGLDILINLTGGNVKMSKWCNVLKGRSIELDTTVLCTMANRTDEKQPSDRIGFKSGERLKANYKLGNGEKTHAFSLFSTDDPVIDEETAEPFYSNKQYTQFTVGFSEEADCTVDLEKLEIYSSKLTDEDEEAETSLHLMKNGESVHVHVANYAELVDRTYLYKQPIAEEGHHIGIYLSDGPVKEEKAIAMLKLRAIENRIGYIVVADNLFVAAKTNRYKDTQLFKATENKIGFDLQFMQGINSVFQKSASSKQGIPVRFKEQYLSLLQVAENVK
ncbi:hypothetical protein FQV26_13460 [Planococcus sp. CPCC 101016]|uniref:hypothetical protein n=1 Tax=Planococcus sp. CPCC 101016 TaxID=2599617 RepID=UPI0011B5FE76|nr:hypothetical protein [Planococcus sp. CPCC 101016]TWT05435.1 hypothetical protein FQV26_13460 [Planococcus sp. CPCC 101016]